jgi:hypothetical protein
MLRYSGGFFLIQSLFMPRLLLNLRNVPEDESEEVLELMARHHIECYQTPPGPLGITAGGIWLRDREDYPRARELMDEYQAERARHARAEHARAVREGRAETLWTAMRRRPVRTLLYIGLAFFILMIFFGPVVALFRAGS